MGVVNLSPVAIETEQLGFLWIKRTVPFVQVMNGQAVYVWLTTPLTFAVSILPDLLLEGFRLPDPVTSVTLDTYLCFFLTTIFTLHTTLHLHPACAQDQIP
jgi:hypothetical protein